jgi:glutamate-1-semialdehyde 2,1-aminomutase
VTLSTDLYERAKRVIAGGTQLLSKRPEQFLPGGWPAYFRSARGVEVEDLDGRRYVDVTLFSVGACPLGYADPDVDAAVVEAVRAGTIATLNCPEEVELAELLCELHPWAEQVRFARGGGEAMAMAVRIARAATGRDVIALGGYHGWHDFYLAANLDDAHALDAHLFAQVPAAGVPRGLAGSAVPFPDGDLAALERIAGRHGHDLAAIVLEPARSAAPDPAYLAGAKAIARRHGAVLVFDEITSGFRVHVGGAHRLTDVTPDLAVFAKAIGNGYPMAAVVGTRAAMDGVGRTFISSTYFTERVGPTAALATIRKLARVGGPERMCAAGDRMRRGYAELADAHGLAIAQRGLAPLPSFAFTDAEHARAMHTLFTQLMLDDGFLATGAFYATCAHEERHLAAALAAADRAFARVRAARDEGTLAAALRGPVAQPGVARRGGS